MARRMFHAFSEKPDPKNPGRMMEIPVGVAFMSDRSPAFRARIDAIPLNWDGNVVVHLDDPVSVIGEEQEPKSPEVMRLQRTVDDLREVNGEVFAALCRAGPEVADVARLDLAKAIDLLVTQRDAKGKK